MRAPKGFASWYTYLNWLRAELFTREMDRDPIIGDNLIVTIEHPDGAHQRVTLVVIKMEAFAELETLVQRQATVIHMLERGKGPDDVMPHLIPVLKMQEKLGIEPDEIPFG